LLPTDPYLAAPRAPNVLRQLGLFAGCAASFDQDYCGLQRPWLDGTACVDHARAWVAGADRLFEEVLAGRTWTQRWRTMRGEEVREPRLTLPWSLASGEPLAPTFLDAMRISLSARCGVRTIACRCVNPDGKCDAAVR